MKIADEEDYFVFFLLAAANSEYQFLRKGVRVAFVIHLGH